MAEQTDVQRELQALEADLKRLEAEYTMFFAGRLARPPWETRGRVDALFKRWGRTHIQASVDRFKFDAMQTRYQKFVDLWDRGLRAREEGRPGPFSHASPKAPPKKEREPEAKLVHVTAFTDPMREMDKLHSLYDSLMDARRGAGEDVVPFHKFAALVKTQVGKLREAGNPEVAFRVAVKDGKVSFTVRGLKGAEE